jgi:hypothetical protein
VECADQGYPYFATLSQRWLIHYGWLPRVECYRLIRLPGLQGKAQARAAERNGLINRSRSYFGLSRASIRGQRSPILPPRASRTPRSGRALQLFIRQFQSFNSRKLSFRRGMYPETHIRSLWMMAQRARVASTVVFRSSGGLEAPGSVQAPHTCLSL